MKKIGNTLWRGIESIILFLLKLIHIDPNSKMAETIMQFVKFGIVGLSNTVLGYLIYVVSLQFFRMKHYFVGVDIYVAQVVMFVLSVAWSFYWNNKVVFGEKEDTHRNMLLALVKTYITYAFTNLILSEILLIVWVDLLKISEYVAPVLNLLITVPLNFLLQKIWAFRSVRGKKND